MITEKKQEFQQAFLLTLKELEQLGRIVDEIKNICDELSKSYENSQYRDDYSNWRIACSDGTTYTTCQFSDVKEFDNPERKKIEALSLEAGEPRGLTLSLNLSGAGTKNIRYTIRGPIKEVLHINEQVEDFLSAIKPSYDWVVGRQSDLVVIMALIGIIPANYYMFMTSENEFSFYSLIVTIPLAYIVLMFISMAVIKPLQLFAAPSAIFALNAGTKEIERYKGRRQFLVYGLLLAIGVPLVIWALQNYSAGYVTTSTP